MNFPNPKNCAMRQTNKFSMTSKLFVATLLLVSLYACQSGQKKTSNDVSAIGDIITEDEIFNDIDKAKKIFYSLPSPIETAHIIKSAGAEYDEELLNSRDKVENYSTNLSMALNLGIYTTDLSFASLFDQAQTSISYMGAARAMAEGLNITDAIDNETMDRLEQNLSDRKVVMDIISETFLNSSSYLKENERQDVAALVLVGGWVEGLYLASELVGDKPIEGNELANRILEQKLSFNILMRLLEDNIKSPDSESENEDIKNMIANLDGLNKAFDKVRVEPGKTTNTGTDEQGVAQISSKTDVSVEPEDFKALQASIKDLRNSFIQ